MGGDGLEREEAPPPRRRGRTSTLRRAPSNWATRLFEAGGSGGAACNAHIDGDGGSSRTVAGSSAWRSTAPRPHILRRCRFSPVCQRGWSWPSGSRPGTGSSQFTIARAVDGLQLSPHTCCCCFEKGIWRSSKCAAVAATSFCAHRLCRSWLVCCFGRTHNVFHTAEDACFLCSGLWQFEAKRSSITWSFLPCSMVASLFCVEISRSKCFASHKLIPCLVIIVSLFNSCVTDQ